MCAVMLEKVCKCPKSGVEGESMDVEGKDEAGLVARVRLVELLVASATIGTAMAVTLQQRLYIQCLAPEQEQPCMSELSCHFDTTM